MPEEDELVTSLALHPSGNCIATGGPRKVRLFRLDGSPERVIEVSDGKSVLGLELRAVRTNRK